MGSDMYLGYGWGELTGPWTDSTQRSSEKSEGAFRQAGTHAYYCMFTTCCCKLGQFMKFKENPF